MRVSHNSTSEIWGLLNKLSDEELAAELMAGRHDALTVLFDRYHKLVFSVAFKMVHDPAEAEEVVQVVFLEIFRALANFDPLKGTLKVWLMQFAYGRAINRRRHLIANRFYDQVSLDAEIPELSAKAWDENTNLPRLIEELLSSLSPRRKSVLELTYFEGLTAKEIGDRLEISPENVRHELYRGLSKLRKAVKTKAVAAKEKCRDSGKEVLAPDAQAL
jgi:RNA polymerase sigma-70 factor (ECF subfamily)